MKYLFMLFFLTCGLQSAYAQWFLQNNPNVKKGCIRIIDFADNNHAIIAGGCGDTMIYISNSSGYENTWNLVSTIADTLGFMPDIYSCVRLSRDTFILGGSTPVVYRTIDAGNTWDITTFPNSYRIETLHFIDKLYGYAMGMHSSNNYSALHKTENGGQYWSQLNYTNNNRYTAFHSPPDTSNYMKGVHIPNTIPQAIIYRSDNGGASIYFTILPSSSTIPQFNDIFYASTDIAYVCAKLIYKTISGGAGSWSVNSLPNPLTSDELTGLFFTDINNGYVIRNSTNPNRQTEIYRTVDGGISWQLDLTVPPGIRLHDIYMLSSETGYAVGDSGAIYQRSGTVNISDEGKLADLTSIYPIPSNESLNIEFAKNDILNEKPTVLVINSMGQEIDVKRFEEFDSTIFDVSALSAGIYFLKISVSNELLYRKFIVSH